VAITQKKKGVMGENSHHASSLLYQAARDGRLEECKQLVEAVFVDGMDQVT
jgi:hypothetical protein